MLRRKNPATTIGVAVACMVALAGTPTPADRGGAVIKRFPAQETLVIAPESAHRAANRDSTAHTWEPVRFAFDGYTLEQSFPLGREAGLGLVVTLTDPAGFRQSWGLSPTFEDDITRAFTNLTSPEGSTEIQAAAARGESMYDVFGQAIERSLDPDDLTALTALGRTLGPIDRRAISRSLDATIRPLLKGDLPASFGAGEKQHSECPGALGTGLVLGAGALGCWLVIPADAGLHAAGCAGLTLGFGGSILTIMTECGGGIGDGCSCWPVKECMCCNVAEGEECLCNCGTIDREPCCDWEKAVHGRQPGSERRGSGR